MRQESIDITDDAVGIVCPVYAVEMPMMVRDFIARANIKTDYLFFIYTYGMGYAEAFAHAKKATDAAGTKIHYIHAIQMVDNYLPVFEMQNQIDTLPSKNVESQIDRVCRDIAERKQIDIPITEHTEAEIQNIPLCLPFPFCEKIRLEIILCTRCGICAKVCPANNITVTDRVYFADRCEVCYACLHNCPQNALHHPSEQSAVRFRNEHVTLKDIITANQ
ncbi:MAG: EFR1 family ferrodoxin [Proteobacteria bacterium]|nr:EFR1 family ferrodoxin [Pseudomonadota bacterium]